jgi:peptide/nickel transport system substrate-binding protein
MSLSINKYLSVTLVIVFVTALISCKTNKFSDKKIFRYNESAGIATLDPAFAKNQAIMWPVHQLYNTLVEVDDNMNIKPSLAKSWDFSTDGRSIIFHLRQDVFFHDDPVFKNGKGRKLIANDIAYSLHRIIDEKIASPGAWIFNGKVDSLNPFIVVNDSTFKIVLTAPYPPILGVLSMSYCSVLAKEAVEYYASDFRRHPVGTGPFSFVAWDEGQALVFKRNNHYFEKDVNGTSLPYLDGIKISFLDSKASEFMEFRQQHLDFINDIEPSFKDELLSKSGDLKKEWMGKIVLQKHPYLNTEYLGFIYDSTNSLLKNSPWKNKKIRQAVNYAIDRNKLLLYLRNSIGTAATSGFIPAGMPSFNSEKVKGYDYNPERSKELLKQAGFDDLHPLPVLKLYTVPNYVSIGSFLVNELNQAGIPAILETVQKSLLLEQMSKSQVLFFRGSWIADFPDASNYLSVFYSKNPAPPNYTRYKNALYDSMFEASFQISNDSIRYRVYQSMDRMILEDAPIVPLWYDMVLQFLQPGIKNFKTNAMNMLELKNVKK